MWIGPAPDCASSEEEEEEDAPESRRGCCEAEDVNVSVRVRCLSLSMGGRENAEEALEEGNGAFSLVAQPAGGTPDGTMSMMSSIGCRMRCAARLRRRCHHAKNAASATRASTPVTMPTTATFARPGSPLCAGSDSYRPSPRSATYVMAVSTPEVGETSSSTSTEYAM